MPPVVVVVLGDIAIQLVADAGVYVAEKAWHSVNKTPVLNFHRPTRIYDPKSGHSFVLQSNGTYRVVAGPAQI